LNSKKRMAGTIAVCAALLAVPASASAQPDNWGQEVGECNATSCYPAGGHRGGYVGSQARDPEAPGYALEVQSLALNPRGLGNDDF